MVSGQGVFSSKGRCYPAFVDYMKCYNSQIYPQDHCQSQLEEYFECLHHRKEVPLESQIINVIVLLESTFNCLDS